MGGAKKKIAVSFDDGPDPQWTPKILDILKEKKAPREFSSLSATKQINGPIS